MPPGPRGNFNPPQGGSTTRPPQLTAPENGPVTVMTKPVILVPSTEQKFSVVNKRSVSPLGETQPTNPSAYPYAIPRPNRVSAADLKKAPKVQSNYMVHSLDDKSTQAYGYHNITIMPLNSRENGTQGNRWYDHDRKNSNTQSTNIRYH